MGGLFLMQKVPEVREFRVAQERPVLKIDSAANRIAGTAGGRLIRELHAGLGASYFVSQGARSAVGVASVKSA